MKSALKLDAVDLRILEAVQENARITKIALAEKVGLSPTPCWLRLRKLEEAGVVTGYHARIAFRKIAPIAHIMVQITLGNHRQSDFDRFERAITVIPEIVSCWSVGGGVDYFLMIMARDVDAYQRLIDRLLDQNIGIERYFTYIVTKLVKDERTGTPLSILAEDIE
ncbi:Lrp/AsnC family transcriptional regulator [Brucella pseudogrignonensis]|uniref:Lrp/AsnC family transcriptional regulator n=1 Tax=Brucella pseudogrignonensis TaxID=419475 RepID=UPI000CFB3DC7|nr:Lrp/AsnC family transcriptional regulator [Brucella pseudogrignonensis]MQP42610.1 winged helix-turn-helix transcriptional regulator [Ochrobactrum sp. MYb237]MCD4513638.1 Lrp/AsnC family transcriptional regulator [Brucella pseudogrignonensis]PQZ41033.1 AsnC family transcriptional regulator [Brucella pseudogrignonensis]PRA37331.1 AsnC family transcriptional regulator [Brucella pseudogrignonensis]PRA62237.1 AsnC family transcriptional regulator [Brucella pseudogrignonensis]